LPLEAVPVKAMVLAAGLGTRLRPLTDLFPKPLLPLMLRPMLGYILSQLRQQGVHEVVVNLHHKADQLTEWLGDGQRWGLHVYCSYEPEILGTAGGIKRVEALLREAPFVVLNADVLAAFDLHALWQWHCQHGAMVTMLVRAGPAARQYGPVVVDSDHRVLHINGRPASQRRLGGEETVFTGIQVVSPEVLEHIPAQRCVSTTAETYPCLIAQTRAVYAYRQTDYWMDLGVPERYLQAHWDMLHGALGWQWLQGVPYGTRVVLNPRMIEQPDVLATIVPPVVLGPQVELQPGARIGPYAVLGEGCRIGSDAVIQRSILLDNVHVAPGVHLEECVLGTAVRVPEASVLRGTIRVV
jgi:mannose-1-phosphate guanylyltransferase